MSSDILRALDTIGRRYSTRDLVMKEREALLTENGKCPALTLVFVLQRRKLEGSWGSALTVGPAGSERNWVTGTFTNDSGGSGSRRRQSLHGAMMMENGLRSA